MKTKLSGKTAFSAVNECHVSHWADKLQCVYWLNERHIPLFVFGQSDLCYYFPEVTKIIIELSSYVIADI
jgi:hypothetical protein